MRISRDDRVLGADRVLAADRVPGADGVPWTPIHRVSATLRRASVGILIGVDDHDVDALASLRHHMDDGVSSDGVGRLLLMVRMLVGRVLPIVEFLASQLQGLSHGTPMVLWETCSVRSIRGPHAELWASSHRMSVPIVQVLAA